MKVRNLAILAALPAAILAANVQAAPEVYGKLNVSLQKNDVESDTAGDITDNWTLESNASRFGIKGSTDLDGGLKGVYKLEFGTSVDEGDGTLSSRNSYLGVQGGFGTVIGGKFDSPTKEAQGKVDQFNDYLLGDIQNVIVGENRPSDIMMYTSPKIAGNITVNLAVIPGEESGTGTGNHDDDPADGVSGSVVYDTENLYLALAADSDVVSSAMVPGMTPPTTVWSGEASLVRLVGQFKMDAFTVGGILQHAEQSGGGDEEQDGIILSGSYTVGKETIKAQYGHSEYDTADTELDSFSIGLDHSMGKDAKAYVYLTAIEGSDVLTVGNDASASTFGVGFEQKF